MRQRMVLVEELQQVGFGLHLQHHRRRHHDQGRDRAHHPARVADADIGQRARQALGPGKAAGALRPWPAIELHQKWRHEVEHHQVDDDRAGCGNQAKGLDRRNRYQYQTDHPRRRGQHVEQCRLVHHLQCEHNALGPTKARVARALQRRVQVQQVRHRVRRDQRRHHGGDQRVGLADCSNQAHRGDHRGAHRHRTQQHRHQAAHHPVQQREAKRHHQRGEDQRVAQHRAHLGGVQRHRAGHRDQGLAHVLGFDRCVELGLDRLTLATLAQFVRPHDQRHRLAVRGRQPARHETVAEHARQALALAIGPILAAVVQRLGIDQRLDDKAVCGAGNMIDAGEREHPVNVRVTLHARAHPIERGQRPCAVQALARKEPDQDLVVGEFGAQLALEHRRRCVVGEVKLGRIVEVEPQQHQRRADHLHDDDDRQRLAPAHQARLHQAQQQRVESVFQHRRSAVTPTPLIRTSPASRPSPSRCASSSHRASAPNH